MLISLLVSVAATFAVQDFEAACNAYVDESGSNIDCTCLVEAAEENPSIAEELLAAEPGDVSGLSEETLEAVADCGGDV